MSTYYGQDKETDRAVEALISREVLACQSSLVDALLKLSTTEDDAIDDFQYDSIENLYPDPSDWDIDECREYLSDHGVVVDDPEADADEWRESVSNLAEPAEIFEWWLITEWAADKLREQNKPLLVVGNDTWWGRTCTGQSIALDPTWYDIYASIDTAQHTPGP